MPDTPMSDIVFNILELYVLIEYLFSGTNFMNFKNQ